MGLNFVEFVNSFSLDAGHNALKSKKCALELTLWMTLHSTDGVDDSERGYKSLRSNMEEEKSLAHAH